MVAQAGSEVGSRLNLPLDNLEGMTYSLAQDRMPVNQFLSLTPPGTNKPEELLLCLLLLGLLRLEAGVRDTARDHVSKPEAPMVEGLAQRVEELLGKFEVANHYEILSVPTDASEEQIKSSYHDLAREFHPDRFQSQEHTSEFRSQVEKLFTYITGAYTVLSNPASRTSYDAKRKEGGKVEAAQEARSGVDRETERMAEALYRSARKMIQDGKYEEAVSILKECVWSRPEVIRYQLYLGIAETEVPRLRKSAEQRLLKAVETDPMRLDTRLALGKLYIKVNLPRRAEAQFQEILRWDPDNPEANKLLQLVSKQL
jgi:curved DNA-binding protein CbpA